MRVMMIDYKDVSQLKTVWLDSLSFLAIRKIDRYSPSDLLGWQISSFFVEAMTRTEMIVMIGTVCPESTVRLFIAPAILGPPVQVFPLKIQGCYSIISFSVKVMKYIMF